MRIEQLSDDFIKSNNGSLDNIRSIQLIAKDILDNFDIRLSLNQTEVRIYGI